MKKILILLFLILISTVILVSCINPFLPVYEKTETEEDGICVVIDGVKYKEKPFLKWDTNEHEKIIGYAGDGKISVHVIKGDTNRNFMFLQGFWDAMYIVYRTDKVIPEPSAEIVDKVLWYDYLDGGYGNEYSYITEDKGTIKELFEVLDTKVVTTEFNSIRKDSRAINIGIACYSSKLPGAIYNLYIGISNGKIICGDGYENEYVELPLDLM